ncbi:MAG: trypsin-like peptidase domain-containing protein [Ardenticatenaceae bacterium]|nr:trypsin-like peptidase domain-containing protein [Ardenticatenaceae bacterium]
MNRKFALTAGIGCTVLLVLAVVAVAALFVPFRRVRSEQAQVGPTAVQNTLPAGPTSDLADALSTQEALPTLSVGTAGTGGMLELTSTTSEDSLIPLYQQLNPGVVNIQIFINQGLGAQGAGSGFILDDAGHIVTNNHVVADADIVTVIFYNGFESNAEVLGVDDDSDLAVLQVDQMADGAHPLPLGDSDQLQAGQWVVAIGNPFSLGGSITLGIVSAVGRSIPSGVTPFAIPQAIQTDAAINPGNSGGPLLNLSGEVVGVNAQIRTGGSVAANSGVGFAVPVNVVRRVVPVLLEQGTYQWPWLGINQPASVNLLLAEANNLPTQQGVYIHEVVPGGPAAQAGLRGSTGSTAVNGLDIPTGGDVILEVNGQQLNSLDTLLEDIAFSRPGDQMTLTILRDGEQQQVSVTLAARPQNFEQFQQ